MKRLLVVLLLLMAIGAGIAYVVFAYPGMVVKAALEYWAPDVLGTPVSVDDIQISARTGRGAIRGLEIGNPPGFTSKRAVRFGEIRIAIDPFTLPDDVILVQEIVVDAPQITYERGKSGNLEVIQGYIDRYAKRADAKEDAKAAPGASLRRRFIIERLEIRGGKVLLTNPLLKGQGITLDLPDVLLRDVGKGKGGVTASEAAALVASTLLSKIPLRSGR
ncbi:MAG: hypothetical protein ABIQ72_03015 [Usitatibacter sp.]